jgi:hypothetical protein
VKETIQETPSSSERFRSTDDTAEGKGSASPKGPRVSDSSSTTVSSQTHEVSSTHFSSMQPSLATSEVPGAVSSSKAPESVAETQSSRHDLPMDSAEPGKANSAGPVKEISIRVQSSSGETVHVKVVDQASQVEIGVRSSSASLATTLRQDLSSLTTSLDGMGWKSEVTAAPTPASMAESGSGANEQQDPSHTQTAPEWWNSTEQNRRSPNELWEEALNRKSR